MDEGAAEQRIKKQLFKEAPAYRKRDTDLAGIANVERPENKVLLRKLKNI